MQKFINNAAATVVPDAPAGLAAATTVVTRAAMPPGAAEPVCGGGSGHEPLPAGLLGPGMLDAACPGEIVTSPVLDQTPAVATPAGGGAGMVVKDCTGDVMNFEPAAEMAAEGGIAVETVVYVTSLDMAGASLSVRYAGDRTLPLDAPGNASAPRWGVRP